MKPQIARLRMGVEQEFYLLKPNGQPGHYPSFSQHQHLVPSMPLEKETNPYLVEVGAGIDASPQDVATTLRQRKEALLIVSEASDQVPVPCGTFPTLNMLAAPEYPNPDSRYLQLRRQYGDYECNSTCGMHIHVGLDHFIQDYRETLLAIFREEMRQLRSLYKLHRNKIAQISHRLTEMEKEIPFVLNGSDNDLLTFILQDWLVRETNKYAWVLQALSSNSPFLNGQDRGRINERLRYMQRMPVHGLMSFASVEEHFTTIVDTMWRGLILNAKEFWWSARSHPLLPTIENRLCDMPLVDDDAVALAALIQALTSWLLRGLLERSPSGFTTQPLLISQRNITETALHGLNGNVVDALAPEEKTTPTLIAIERLIEQVRPEAEGLGSFGFLDYILREICVRGPGSYLQRGWAAQEGGSLEMVSRNLIKTAYNGLRGQSPDWTPAREYLERTRSHRHS